LAPKGGFVPAEPVEHAVVQISKPHKAMRDGEANVDRRCGVGCFARVLIEFAVRRWDGREEGRNGAALAQLGVFL
jgi:hypothetical protein